MDTLYKAILKNYSIKVADNVSNYDSSKEWIYTKIFYTLEEYIQNILSLKIETNYDENVKNMKSEYEKYESYEVGKLDTRDNIEKNMVLLGISRKLFTHRTMLWKIIKRCKSFSTRHENGSKKRKSLLYVN